MNLCRACNTDFTSVAAFDRHRVGKYEYRWSPEHEDGRRCLDEDEMREAGMELDKRGRWRITISESEQERLTLLRASASLPKRLRATG